MWCKLTSKQHILIIPHLYLSTIKKDKTYKQQIIAKFIKYNTKFIELRIKSRF